MLALKSGSMVMDSFGFFELVFLRVSRGAGANKAKLSLFLGVCLGEAWRRLSFQ